MDGCVCVCVCSVNVKQLRDEYTSADDSHKKWMEQRYGRKNIEKLIEDAFTQEWLTDNAKKCPQCSAHIQVQSHSLSLLCSVYTLVVSSVYNLLHQQDF